MYQKRSHWKIQSKTYSYAIMSPSRRNYRIHLCVPALVGMNAEVEIESYFYSRVMLSQQSRVSVVALSSISAMDKLEQRGRRNVRC